MTSVPLFKTSEQDPNKVRPVGIQSSLRRVLDKEVVRANKPALTEYLEPEQLCLSQGGAQKLVHSVRMMAEANPDFQIITLDMENAHNTVSKKAVIQGLEDIPSLWHMAWHMATSLASFQSLESGGEEWGECEDGVTQGGPQAGGRFSVAWHKDVRALHARLAAAGGQAKFGNDDGYACGPSEVVFEAVEEFRAAIKARCNLTLNMTKSKVYLASGELPAQAPPGMDRAGLQVGDRWLPGFRAYGVFIGSKEYVKFSLMEKVAGLGGLREEVDKVMEVLKEDSQAAWVLLSTSLSQQLDYSLSLQYPSDMLEAAAAMDQRLWEALQQVSGQSHIPRGEEGLGIECVVQVPGVPGLEGRSYQSWVAAQPVNLGGLGLRSLVETRLPAFIEGVEQAFPHMMGQVGRLGICPQLQEVVGRVEGRDKYQQFLAHWRTKR